MKLLGHRHQEVDQLLPDRAHQRVKRQVQEKLVQEVLTIPRQHVPDQHQVVENVQALLRRDLQEVEVQAPLPRRDLQVVVSAQALLPRRHQEVANEQQAHLHQGHLVAKVKVLLLEAASPVVAVVQLPAHRVAAAHRVDRDFEKRIVQPFILWKAFFIQKKGALLSAPLQLTIKLLTLYHLNTSC